MFACAPRLYRRCCRAGSPHRIARSSGVDLRKSSGPGSLPSLVIVVCEGLPSRYTPRFGSWFIFFSRETAAVSPRAAVSTPMTHPGPTTPPCPHSLPHAPLRVPHFYSASHISCRFRSSVSEWARANPLDLDVRRLTLRFVLPGVGLANQSILSGRWSPAVSKVPNVAIPFANPLLR